MRATISHNHEAILRKARFQSPHTFVSLNSRLESNEEADSLKNRFSGFGAMSASFSFCRATLTTTLGQMAPPKSGRVQDHHLRGVSGGIPRGCPLLGNASCPHVVSRVEAYAACSSCPCLYTSIVYVYVYERMRIRAYTFTSIFYVYLFVCVCLFSYVYQFLYVYLVLNVYLFLNVCLFVYACLFVYVLLCVYAYPFVYKLQVATKP